MCRFFHCKDLIGSALPAVPNNELDSTPTNMPLQPGRKANGGKAASSEEIGIGVFTKLMFFGVIVGAVMMFLRSRKSPVQKNLA